MKPEERLEIERLGGFAGIGLPGSRIRSRAMIEGAALSAAERETIASLFDAARGQRPQVPDGADAFRYRLTLHGRDGPRAIEVGAAAVPESLQARVQDELI